MTTDCTVLSYITDEAQLKLFFRFLQLHVVDAAVRCTSTYTLALSSLPSSCQLFRAMRMAILIRGDGNPAPPVVIKQKSSRFP